MLCRTVLIFLVLISSQLKAQEHLFSDISDTPETISASHILAHNIRAIGFRYFWATQDLTAQDLGFRPSEGARSTQETLEHLYGLATMIASAVEDEIFQRPKEHQLWPQLDKGGLGRNLADFFLGIPTPTFYGSRRDCKIALYSSVVLTSSSGLRMAIQGCGRLCKAIEDCGGLYA